MNQVATYHNSRQDQFRLAPASRLNGTRTNHALLRTSSSSPCESTRRVAGNRSMTLCQNGSFRSMPSCSKSKHADKQTPRPQPRGYLRRLTSRLIHTNNEWQNLRAVRMPRREYLKHHKRDEEGNYAGTEPQQDWDDAMLKSCYGRYQRAPLVPNGLYQNAAMRY